MATSKRGKIGRQDMALWDGGDPKTFNRQSSTGGVLTLNQFDWFVDVLSVFGNGTDYTYNSLNSAISAIGLTNKRALFLSPGTWTVDTNLTVTSNLTLVCPPGTTLSVSSGITLTIEGPVLAGAYQIFSGSGTVTISANIVEHGKWRDGSGDEWLPAVDNTVDLGSSTKEFKDGYFDGTVNADGLKLGTGATPTTVLDEDDMASDSATALATQQSIKAYVDAIGDTGTALPGLVIRPKFTWKDADEIYISPGVYHHQGTTEQLVYWDSQLTFQFGSGGSNAGSDDLSASDHFYVFLDDSAIVTQGAALLDAGCFIAKDAANVTVEWNAAKHGWYETTATSDRCIFSVLTSGASAVLEFFHDGDFVAYADYIEELGVTDIDDTFTDIDLSSSIPEFATLATLFFWSSYVDGVSRLSWRTNGQTGSTGHSVAYSDGDSHESTNTAIVQTDSSQIIEVRYSLANGNTMRVYSDGWYFPHGM